MYKKSIAKLSAVMVAMTLFSSVNVQSATVKTTKVVAKKSVVVAKKTTQTVKKPIVVVAKATKVSPVKVVAVAAKIVKPTVAVAKVASVVVAKPTTVVTPVTAITAKTAVAPTTTVVQATKATTVAPTTTVVQTAKATTTTSTIVSGQTPVKTTDNLSTALASGKSLLLDAGSFSIATITKIASSVTIEGKANTVINGNNSGSFSVAGLHDVEFKNIIFTNLTEMDFSNSTNLKFTNCQFLNFTTSGVVLNTFNNVEFSNCIISKIGSINVDETWQGMGLYLVNGTNLKVHDSQISNTFGHGAIFLTNTSFQIYNNKIHDTFYRGIELYLSGNSGSIYNNNIYNCGSINTDHSGIGCNGIYGANASKVTVISNIITNVLENAVEGNFLSIEKNTIDGTGIDMVNHPTPSGEGIYLEGSGKVIGNIIKNTHSSGIKSYSPLTISNVDIEQNTISNCDAADCAIDLNSDLGYSNINISNNKSYNNKECVGLRYNSRVNVILVNNTIN